MILSVSRRCDIPAFFGKWFLNRLKEGFVCVRNPYDDSSATSIEQPSHFKNASFL